MTSSSPVPRRTVVAAAAAAVLLPAAGCGLPEPDSVDHRQAVQVSLQSALGDARTARIVLGAWLLGRATDAYTAVVLDDGEKGVGLASGDLRGMTPPRSGDRLQAEAEDAVARAESAVTAARLAVARGDRPAAREALEHLDGAGGALARLVEALG